MASFASGTCSGGKYKVNSYSRSAYYKADGTFVPSTTVKEHCRVYSSADHFLKNKMKTKTPSGWPNKSEIFHKWSTEKKVRVIEAFEEIPEVLWSNQIEGIYLARKSKDYPNPASNGNGHLVFYDTAFGKQQRLSRILAHELAHMEFGKLTAKVKNGLQPKVWLEYRN